ncbi:bile acid:sodium symporter [Bradyrhizobium sp. BWC-3-1]|uniref:bile acid:sodium symporter n=1 Tax=Bradyrhizobium sp. BWC-3-1 TaxID=3080012 RepID=UPI00397890A2
MLPLLGLAIRRLPAPVLSPSLAADFLFLTLLPSTVQSSIAFTAIGCGNVSAAVCSASLFNVLGVFMTPLLLGLYMSAHSATPLVGPPQSDTKEALAAFTDPEMNRCTSWTRRVSCVSG